jgi:hypothetical protein
VPPDVDVPILERNSKEDRLERDER